MDLGKRILTSIVGIPILIALILAGRISFFVLIEIAIFISILEYINMVQAIDGRPTVFVTIVGALGLPLVNLYGGLSADMAWLLLWFTLALGVETLSRKRINWDCVRKSFIGVIYIGGLFTVLTMIFSLKDGSNFVLYTFAAVWVADTSAFFIGRFLGRNKLAPRLSPNKTVEGAIGALVVTAAVFGLLSFMPGLTTIERVIFGLSIALAAGLGDLFESSLKRQAGVKDSGSILPGHGGFLDRVDSLLFGGVASFLLLKLMTGLGG